MDHIYCMWLSTGSIGHFYQKSVQMAAPSVNSPISNLPVVLPRFGLVLFRFFISFFVVENAVINITTQVMMGTIAPLHNFQIKKDLFKSVQPILRYSKNNKQLFWMVPKWLTVYLANYVINQWPTAFGPISNPSVCEVLYLVKYLGSFNYFTSHNIKNWF